MLPTRTDIQTLLNAELWASLASRASVYQTHYILSEPISTQSMTPGMTLSPLYDYLTKDEYASEFFKQIQKFEREVREKHGNVGTRFFAEPCLQMSMQYFTTHAIPSYHKEQQHRRVLATTDGTVRFVGYHIPRLWRTGVHPLIFRAHIKPYCTYPQNIFPIDPYITFDGTKVLSTIYNSIEETTARIISKAYQERSINSLPKAICTFGCTIDFGICDQGQCYFLCGGPYQCTRDDFETCTDLCMKSLLHSVKHRL